MISGLNKIVRSAFAVVLPVLAIAATACGPQFDEAPDFTSKHGVKVYAHGHAQFDRATVDAMEQYLVDQLVTKQGFKREDVLSCLSEAKVGVFSLDELAQRGGADVAGLQQGNVLQVGAFGCAWDSAYVHEMAHWLQYCRRWVDDPSHDVEPAVWATVNARPATQHCNAPDAVSGR
jgi:hypothetical protein